MTFVMCVDVVDTTTAMQAITAVTREPSSLDIDVAGSSTHLSHTSLVDADIVTWSAASQSNTGVFLSTLTSQYSDDTQEPEVNCGVADVSNKETAQSSDKCRTAELDESRHNVNDAAANSSVGTCHIAAVYGD